MNETTKSQESISAWEIHLARVLKLVIIITAVVQFVRGNFIFGAGVLIALGLISLPAYLSRNNRHPFPVEIEILLSLILVVHLTLGLALDFYDTYENYDKILHYGNSVLISFIGFMAAYALYFTGRLRASPIAIAIVILFLTLGIGGLWEIVEYASDQLIYGRIDNIQKQQGSPSMDPLDDTMWDLIGNTVGGIFGALLGGLYIRYSRKTNSRRFVEVMEALGEVTGDDEAEPQTDT
jgi:hypothetical protein